MSPSRRNSGVWLSLTFAGIVAAYALLFATTPLAQAYGDVRDQQRICILLTGILGLLYWLSVLRGRHAIRTGWKWEWLGICLPAYALFQVLPLPLSVVGVVSPARARLVDLLVPMFPKPAWVPLSVAPAATVYHCLLMAMCGVVFLVVYDIGSRLTAHPWAVVLPLVVLAAAEAVLGLVQAHGGGQDAIATGTFKIRNHYSGFLEMVLPFAALRPMSILNREIGPGRRSEVVSIGPVLLACIGLGAAALILMGILASLSRMGFLSALGSMTFMGLVALCRGRSLRRTWPALAAVIVIVVLAMVFLLSGPFMMRFLETAQEDRPEVWRETGRLIAAYPLFGCGLGAYESAFYQYKASNPAFYQEYAHNDYLQYLAEMGVVGFVIGAVPLALILARLRRGWSQRFRPDGGWLSIACAGSAVAIGLHSIADFNLYIPADMLVFAWVMGIAGFSGAVHRHPHSAGHPDSIPVASGILGRSTPHR